MSTWLTVEDAVVAALKLVQVSGQAALATVKGETSRDRKVLAVNLGRERLPAAYVVVSGRDTSDKNYRRAGDELLTVVYAVTSERSDAEARRGGTGVAGVFAVAEAAATALQDLLVAGSRRLLLIDERAIGGEEGTALWEQRYEVRVKSGPGYPLYAGTAPFGQGSEVQVEVGSLERGVMTFAFPGVDGVFERSTGTRERPIVLRGQLRASNDTALAALERGLEDLVQQATVDNLYDAWGQQFRDCSARRFTRKGARRVDDLTGQVMQDFEFEFAQLLR